VARHCPLLGESRDNLLVMAGRKCSKTGCDGSAVATLTYIYADSMAVLGPLATYAEPHAYDLCALHSDRLTAPLGWEVVRLEENHATPEPSDDDLLAIANAVREAARPLHQEVVTATLMPEVGRRGHLRVLPTDR